ncbi:MAG: transglutaminase-like domain-containing protein [Candidatus Aegiribacteria sp.]|nr:transglutaminase-like domain-containing protein [Candidatus Aegiribacteria sp.]
MISNMLFALLTLAGIAQNPVSTARRLMLDGYYQQAEEVLEAVLEVDSEQRTDAGFLLEILQQTRDYYNLSASEALDLARDILGESINASWFLGRLAPTDTIRIDGHLRYPGFRIEQLASGHDKPFLYIPGNSAWLRNVYSRASNTGYSSYSDGVSGTYNMTFMIDSISVNTGDSLNVWIPIAGNFNLQEASIPDWQIFGIDVLKLEINLEDPGRLPVLYISGTAVLQESDHIIIQISQEFTVYPMESMTIDSDNIVLPVPGVSTEIDLALADSRWIDPTGEMFIHARHISGTSPDPLAKVESIVRYITDSLRICEVPTGLYIYEGLSRSVSRNKCGDTAGISAFFAAACRALGIPTRVCGGYSCSDGDPVFHCRNEFMVSDGIWTSVDIAFHTVDLCTNGNSLTFSYSSMGGCDAARVYTLPSLEDTLFPAKQSWPVAFPGSLPEAELRSAGGFWTSLSVAEVTSGTDLDIQWQF